MQPDIGTPDEIAGSTVAVEALHRLARNWELEAQALEAVRYQCQARADQDALRECASVYRKCASDLIAKIKTRRLTSHKI